MRLCMNSSFPMKTPLRSDNRAFYREFIAFQESNRYTIVKTNSKSINGGAGKWQKQSV